MGEWQTRAQVSTLLLPNAARTIFWTTQTSSLVQRDEVMPPIDLRPYLAWIAFSRLAPVSMASCQPTSRHGSSVESRTIGVVMRSWWFA